MTALSKLSFSLPQYSSPHQNYCFCGFFVVFSPPLEPLLIFQVYKAFFPVTLILISVEKKVNIDLVGEKTEKVSE